MRIITLDFETFWDSKDKYALDEMSYMEYILDPRFEVQLMGIREGYRDVEVLEGDDIDRALKYYKIDEPDVCLVGHNIRNFDAKILNVHYKISPNFIMDTMELGKFFGILKGPGGSLARLSDYLGNGTKEKGTIISDGKHWPNDFTEEEREKFRNYCHNDVLLTCFNFIDLVKKFPLMI